MNYDTEEMLATVIAILLLILFIGGIAVAINYASCNARWEGTFKTDFGIMQGCRIKVAPDKWIPEDRS